METGLRVPNDENKPIIDLNWYFYFFAHFATILYE